MGTRWIIFYADGTSFSSDDGAPHEAPRWGIVCIAAPSADHGRVLWIGKDYFWWDENEWINGDFTGLIDYLTRPGREKIVLVGRGIPPTRFHAICKQALADPRLPSKTSTDWLEATET